MSRIAGALAIFVAGSIVPTAAALPEPLAPAVDYAEDVLLPFVWSFVPGAPPTPPVPAAGIPEEARPYLGLTDEYTGYANSVILPYVSSIAPGVGVPGVPGVGVPPVPGVGVPPVPGVGVPDEAAPYVAYVGYVQATYVAPLVPDVGGLVPAEARPTVDYVNGTLVPYAMSLVP